MLLSQYLKKYRITKREFAEKIGVTNIAIWHYISGRRIAPPERAKKIEEESDGLVKAHEIRG